MIWTTIQLAWKLAYVEDCWLRLSAQRLYGVACCLRADLLKRAGARMLRQTLRLWHDGVGLVRQAAHPVKTLPARNRGRCPD